MTYRIEHAVSKRDAMGACRYLIFEDRQLVARYWHDFRGEEHGIEFIHGFSESQPLGGVADFIEGGGPLPLRLTLRAEAYLKEKLSCGPSR